ncbi:putative pectate lyase 2 [Hibiscus syriacus]|uniref:putative pectate lyase 2 n=1 Tax=Hibiscus syriacus TaxID=106335 RepID=UPI0019215C5C|nr:putative pectate lyase 2 [Hibiscus syriacus]
MKICRVVLVAIASASSGPLAETGLENNAQTSPTKLRKQAHIFFEPNYSMKMLTKEQPSLAMTKSKLTRIIYLALIGNDVSFVLKWFLLEWLQLDICGSFDVFPAVVINIVRSDGVIELGKVVGTVVDPNKEDVRSKVDFLMDDVLAMENDGIQIRFDIRGESGTFAARMAKRNVTVITNTLNLDAPHREFIVARGLFPLFLSLNQGSSPSHVGMRGGSDGDAISVFASSNIWIDHCYLMRSRDGLIDVIHASTTVTISNNYFSQHDKMMLLGHRDTFTADKVMKVTIVFNRFGEGLIERMPRVRIGYAHVANSRYDEWKMYAIGGSANPTIFSEGNYFVAPDNPSNKQVTKREASNWQNWRWQSSKDVFTNGAYFVSSGYGSCAPLYTWAQSFTTAPGYMVPVLTSNAGPLRCVVGKPC